MRIEIFGNNALVSSVEASTTAADLHLLVNLAERWGPVHCQGSSRHYAAPEGAPRPEHDALLVSSSAVNSHAEPCSEAEVVLIAETPEESLQLGRTLRYTQQEKEQFCVLYVPVAQLRHQGTLARYRSAA